MIPILNETLFESTEYKILMIKILFFMNNIIVNDPRIKSRCGNHKKIIGTTGETDDNGGINDETIVNDGKRHSDNKTVKEVAEFKIEENHGNYPMFPIRLIYGTIFTYFIFSGIKKPEPLEEPQLYSLLENITYSDFFELTENINLIDLKDTLKMNIDLVNNLLREEKNIAMELLEDIEDLQRRYANVVKDLEASDKNESLTTLENEILILKNKRDILVPAITKNEIQLHQFKTFIFENVFKFVTVIVNNKTNVTLEKIDFFNSYYKGYTDISLNDWELTKKQIFDIIKNLSKRKQKSSEYSKTNLTEFIAAAIIGVFCELKNMEFKLLQDQIIQNALSSDSVYLQKTFMLMATSTKKNDNWIRDRMYSILTTFFTYCKNNDLYKNENINFCFKTEKNNKKEKLVIIIYIFLDFAHEIITSKIKEQNPYDNKLKDWDYWGKAEQFLDGLNPLCIVSFIFEICSLVHIICGNDDDTRKQITSLFDTLKITNKFIIDKNSLYRQKHSGCEFVIPEKIDLSMSLNFIVIDMIINLRRDDNNVKQTIYSFVMTILNRNLDITELPVSILM